MTRDDGRMGSVASSSSSSAPSNVTVKPTTPSRSTSATSSTTTTSTKPTPRPIKTGDNGRFRCVAFSVVSRCLLYLYFILFHFVNIYFRHPGNLSRREREEGTARGHKRTRGAKRRQEKDTHTHTQTHTCNHKCPSLRLSLSLSLCLPVSSVRALFGPHHHSSYLPILGPLPGLASSVSQTRPAQPSTERRGEVRPQAASKWNTITTRKPVYNTHS